MPGRHTAENVKIAIEKITNTFSFDKTKIISVFSDEGSNLLKLFKQPSGVFYIESDSIDDLIETDDDEDRDLNLT